VLKQFVAMPKKAGILHPNIEDEFVLSTTVLHWQRENELGDVTCIFHLKVLLGCIFSLIIIVISFKDLQSASSFGREVPFVNSSIINYNNCIFR